LEPSKYHECPSEFDDKFCVLCARSLQQVTHENSICIDCVEGEKNEPKHLFCQGCSAEISLDSVKEYGIHCEDCFAKSTIAHLFDEFYKSKRKKYYSHLKISYCDKCDQIDPNCEDSNCIFFVSPPHNLNETLPFNNPFVRNVMKRPRNSQPSKFQNVEFFFSNIKDELIKKIKESSGVLGCVAWLNEETILDTVSKKLLAPIIINKDEFTQEKLDLMTAPKVHWTLGRHLDPEGFYDIEDIKIDGPMEAVRCLGTSSKMPKMHHKFLIFFRDGQKNFSKDKYDVLGDLDVIYEPVGVWTGSFNFTNNANNSLENAVYIEDQHIASSYFQEYLYCLSLSEDVSSKSARLSPKAKYKGMTRSELYKEISAIKRQLKQN
jgi:hypothetical protein